MKKNTFYVICGILAVMLVVLFYYAVQVRMPVLIIIGVLIALGLFFLLRRMVTDIFADERQTLIDMKTCAATLKTGAALFILGNIPIAIYAFSIPPMIMRGPRFVPPPASLPLSQLGVFSLFELSLLVAVLFLYVAFHIHYTHKYGGDLQNEE